MTTEDILIVCEHALKPYEGGNEAFKKVKTALEQEPTTKNDLAVDCISRKRVLEWLENATDDSIEHAINSNLEFIPSVTPQEPVLEKIRTEIEQTSETIDGFLMHDGTKRTVLQIIDKYKAESE